MSDGSGLAPAEEHAWLLAEMSAIEADLERLVVLRRDDVAAVDPRHAGSARNLLHYLGLRGRDLRPAQVALARRGLSSLGRCEPHVAASVRAVAANLRGAPAASDPHPSGVPGFDEGWATLERNAADLLGPRPADRGVRIMVTLPSEAAHDPALVHRLVARGMDVARVNSAHDTPDDWRAMAAHVRAAAKALGRTCLVSMDLAGPKIRTGPLEPGPAVVRVRPRRDLRGAPVTPGRALLVGWQEPDGPPPPTDDDSREGAVRVPVDPGWLAALVAGDTIRLRDARDSGRTLTVVATGEAEGRPTATVETSRTTYLATGTRLTKDSETTQVGPLPERRNHHLLFRGDVLRMTRDLTPAPAFVGGDCARRSDGADMARIGCTYPAVFDAVKVEDPVSLDDGKLSGVVERIGTDWFDVRVLRAPATGAKLRADKGVNLPATRLPHEGLTEEDRAALAVAAEIADIVAVSFVRSRADLAEVQERIEAAGRREDLGVILKIETTEGFANLPDLLLRAMRSPRAGVMIARGDLAVEGGYQRLAELQEEILWLAAAAHLPVVWATEVLDRLAKTGVPARAEVTDAAQGQRAECVMLNKGPHIPEAISALDDILRRMAGHQQKKTPLFRPLRSWLGLATIDR